MLLGMYTDDIVRDRDGAWRFTRRKFQFTYSENRVLAGKVLRQFS
jgi:hypothetical protein